MRKSHKKKVMDKRNKDWTMYLVKMVREELAKTDLEQK